MKLELTLKQYELIFRILSSVGEHFAHGVGSSCQFYNVIGAMILKEALKINARPVMGATFIRINEEGDVIAYAGQEDGRFFSSPEAFHCWVETPNYYIDFTSPEYGESESKVADSIPRKMFQKPKSLIAEAPDLLFNPGDFFFSENSDLTQQLLRRMFSIPATGDLANICLDWYKKSKKKIVPELAVMDDLGEMTPIKLKSGGLQSAW